MTIGRHNGPVHTSTSRTPAGAVLVVAGDRAVHRLLSDALRPMGVRCRRAASVAGAQRMVQRADFDAVLVVDEPGSPVRGVPCIVLTTSEGGALAIEAFRAGAADVVPLGRSDDLAARLASALKRARRRREQQRMLERYAHLTGALRRSRRVLQRRVHQLRTELDGARRAWRRDVERVAASVRYEALVRQELDLEPLLRSTLEYVLDHSGPTNGAVYLPSHTGDLTLGAFVNTDWPRESVDLIMDQLADLASGAQDQPSTVVVPAERMTVFLGGACPFLERNSLTLTACRWEDECLAVIALFRRSPFPPALVETLDLIAPTFARQLNRIVCVHHRHLPREEWGLLGEPHEDDEHGALD